MSAMKAFMYDRTDIQDRAVHAAEVEDAREGLRELTDLFRLCGTLARAYPCPRQVMDALRQEATFTYQRARKRVLLTAVAA